MSETQSLLEQTSKIEQVCSVCDRISHGEMISVDTLAPNVRRILESNAPNVEAFCARCHALFQRAQRQIDLYYGEDEPLGPGRLMGRPRGTTFEYGYAEARTVK